MLPVPRSLLLYIVLASASLALMIAGNATVLAGRSPAPVGKTVVVTMKQTGPETFIFSPANITVSVGDTVRWINTDTVPHTSTSDDDVWDSDNMDPKAEYSFTFEKPGAYPYFCAYHAGMEGTVTVKQAAPPAATATPAPTTTAQPPTAVPATATSTRVPPAPTSSPAPPAAATSTRAPEAAPTSQPELTATTVPPSTATSAPPPADTPAAPSVAASPTPSSTPAPTTTGSDSGATPVLPLLAGGALVLGAGAAAWLFRRNR